MDDRTVRDQVEELRLIIRIPAPIVHAVNLALEGGVTPEQILERVYLVAGRRDDPLLLDLAAYLRIARPIR